MSKDVTQYMQGLVPSQSSIHRTPGAFSRYLHPSVLFHWIEKHLCLTWPQYESEKHPFAISVASVRSAAMQTHDEPDTKDGTWQAELVARCLNGDESAFSTLSDQYGTLLLRTAYLVIGDEDVAEDIVQDTLILAWRKLATLREPWHLRAWLLKITLNQSMSLKRQLARRSLWLHEQVAQQTRDNEHERFDDHLADSLDIARAIDRLPVNQRAVLVLFYYHHMSMSEIASILDVAENTLRKRLQSALDKVRRVLTSESIASSTPPYFPPTRLREGDSQ
jgi:RNA polymerase sigma-70 factor, ECF subfamily